MTKPFDAAAAERLRAGVRAVEQAPALEVVARLVPWSGSDRDVRWRSAALRAFGALVAIVFAPVIIGDILAVALLRQWGLPRLGLRLALAMGCLCAASLAFDTPVAEARLGGGQTYSGGSSSGGSSNHGGGSSSAGDGPSSSRDSASRSEYSPPGGSGDGDGGRWVFIVAGVFVGICLIGLVANRRSTGGGVRLERPAPRDDPGHLVGQIATLRARDPAFSRFVFLDFCTLLHMRFIEALAEARFEPLRPYLHPGLLARVADERVDEVRDAVIGGVTLQRIELDRAVEAWVEFEASYRERRGTDWVHRYSRQVWTFSRGPDVTSPEPEGALRLGCPACGAAAELDVNGRCPYCDEVVDNGRFGWRATRINTHAREVVTRIPVGPGPGGAEPGTFAPTVFPADFGARKRAFFGRNPAFSEAVFIDRIRFTFMNLQQAWTTLEWEKARPYESDALFQSHRYWIERYRQDGLRNVLDDIQLTKAELCDFEQDAYYDAITTRVHASMLDYTVDQSGTLVGGNRDVPHQFTEYWTFIRRSGVEHRVTDPTQCPSCAAPMQVNQAGLCGFCGTRVVSGDFDWVLALIAQDDIYTV